MNTFVSVPASSSPPRLQPDGFQRLIRHPFALLAVVCLFVNAFFHVESEATISFDAALLSILAAVAGAMVYFGVLRPEKHFGWSHALCFAGAGVALILLLSAVNLPLAVLGVGLSAVVCIAIAWIVLRRMTPSRILLLFLAAGFVLRLAYILYTAYYARQHDVWRFNSTGGHAVYIQWFYENAALPNFDPRTVWQYYHPPLHHILTALFMRLNVALGMSFERACESTQVLTLFYASCSTLLVYKIMRQLGISQKAALLPMALLCFHPTLILMSGSINNDILSLTLQLAALYFALRWYQSPSMGGILRIALALGCSMMSKSSGGLAAVPIAFLFLIKLLEERRHFWKMAGQFAAFAVVVFPLGLWWQVYNFIQHEMPLSYVPLLSNKDAQYIGFRTLWERLFSLDLHQLKSVFVAFGERSSSDYYEYNVFLGLLKTSVFGEFFLFEPETLGNLVSVILFGVNAAVVVVSLFAMGWVFFRRSSASTIIKVFLGLLYFTVLGSYVMFCIQYPHTCTQNMRYAVPTLVVGLCCIGLTMQDWQNRPHRCYRPIRGVLWGLAGAFCAASAGVYALLGV